MQSDIHGDDQLQTFSYEIMTGHYFVSVAKSGEASLCWWFVVNWYTTEVIARNRYQYSTS